ncbi:PAP2-domain-containing protein [Piedraia hortae CBS 480.64]|uniref:Dolichyldiphosphatase n=1 Tax=Piedraia hortae CBS 480.64 TaxID=1314780 RepID=A0A6A7BTN6_9PEZI|nr:PAP2-domain-containing protein [Piedraia hortae CBS 480.64]
MENPPLASLSLTHVHYNPNDPWSHLSAYLALVPQALTITYVTLMWATREAEICLMFAGQMGCEALNWCLKRWIKEERPTQMHGKGYGMPSSHSQYVAFFSTFFSLFILLRHDPHRPHSSSTHIPTPFRHRLALAVLSLFCAVGVTQSRIYLNYHTPRQAYTGFAIGVACALGWFLATGLARSSGLLDWLLGLPPSRWVRLRDLVLHEDLVDPGWERWEQRRATKKNK